MNLEILSKCFLQDYDENSAYNILKICRECNFFDLGCYLGKYFIKYFPKSFRINHLYALCNFYRNCPNKTNYIESYETYLNMLDMDITEEEVYNIYYDINLCYPFIKDIYTFYNKEKILGIQKNTETLKHSKIITFTITTCKRIELFEKTMNSFINCCTDLHLIKEWICIDDNSNEEDRNRMKELYPFFKFYFKKYEEKGHPQSLNILLNMINTPYIFHMEDDWQYIRKRNYITECLEVLSSDINIGQCLINKNFSELTKDYIIKGGFIKKTNSGLRYYIHEYCDNDEKINNFNNRFLPGNFGTVWYWPHFSLRPCIYRKKIFRELGNFDTKVSHFEKEYAYKYIKNGYYSAFLEGINCIHTGRLTSEIDDKTKLNAYSLNNEFQFNGKEDMDIVQPIPEIYKSDFYNSNFMSEFINKINKINNSNNFTVVVNLIERTDRLDKFLKNSNKHLIYNGNILIFPAVNGKYLAKTSQLQQIFDGNDYNMRKGMVGCALSHILLYMLLIQSNKDVMCLLEDDVEFDDNFSSKFLDCINKISNIDWDLIYLGHHKRKVDSDVNKPLEVIKKCSFESLNYSLGGTIGYIINKNGAIKLLNYINNNGMTNGIDTVQQKAADIMNVYYCDPCIVKSECYRGFNKPDSDIQYDYDSLTISIDDRLELEKEFYKSQPEYKELIELKTEYDVNKFILDNTNIDNDVYKAYYYRNESYIIIDILKRCILPCYTLNNNVLIILNKKTEYVSNNRYFKRLNKGNNFDISDCLIYYKK
jgi:glycosyl transferase family 25